MSAAEGEEPPSGFQGKGTVDSPYDQGNAPEPTTSKTAGAEGTGTEPVSGEQGKGTVDEPYDQGNASANRNVHSSSLIDGILGRKKTGKANGTVIDTSTGAPPADDQGPGTSAEPSIKEKAAIAKEKHDLEASQQDAQITEPTIKSEPARDAPKLDTPKIEEPTSPTAGAATGAAGGAGAASTATESSKGKEPERGRGKEFESYSAPREMERSVSPGTKLDGSHATTSGDKGQSYKPPTKLGKLGSKLGIH